MFKNYFFHGFHNAKQENNRSSKATRGRKMIKRFSILLLHKNVIHVEKYRGGDFSNDFFQ